MTIGKKIKYLREHRGITQAELAEQSGIHPVSIRKYETDRMVPQRAQLERLSDALDVQIEDWVDEYIYRLPFHDNGKQTLALLYNLYMNDFIEIKGKRLESGILDRKTVKLTINRNVGNLLSVFSKNEEIDLKHLEIRPSDDILDSFLLLERSIHQLEQGSENYDTRSVSDFTSEEEYAEYIKDFEDAADKAILDMALLKSEVGLVPDPFVRKGESVLIVPADGSGQIPPLSSLFEDKK